MYYSTATEEADVSSSTALFVHFILQVLKVQNHMAFLKQIITTGSNIKTPTCILFTRTGLELGLIMDKCAT